MVDLNIEEIDPESEYEFGTNEVVEFLWDLDEGGSMLEEVEVRYFTLQGDELIKVLSGSPVEIVQWRGSTFSREMPGEEKIDIDEEAFGGYGNTNGVAEMGVIEVNIEMIQNADSVEF